jgi:hypothetical protein
VLGTRSSLSVENVQIIVEISEGEDGRAVGTVTAGGDSQARPFSGNLEFLALVESLYRISADTAGYEAGRTEKEWS